MCVYGPLKAGVRQIDDALGRAGRAARRYAISAGAGARRGRNDFGQGLPAALDVPERRRRQAAVRRRGLVLLEAQVLRTDRLIIACQVSFALFESSIDISCDREGFHGGFGVTWGTRVFFCFVWKDSHSMMVRIAELRKGRRQLCVSRYIPSTVRRGLIFYCTGLSFFRK